MSNLVFVVTGWRANGARASVKRTTLEAAERAAEAMAETSFGDVHIRVRGGK